MNRKSVLIFLYDFLCLFHLTFVVGCPYKLVFIFDIVCIRSLIYHFFNIYKEVSILIIRVENLSF